MVTLFTTLISTLAVAGAPGTAHAGLWSPEIPCPNDPSIVWRIRVAARNVTVFEGVRYTVASASSRFAVSDGRSVDNGLDTPITATFTSQQSRRYTVTVTVGTSAELVSKLQATVSIAIVAERVTAIGVNATVTIPAHSRVTGLYGVDVFDVAYDAHVVWKTGRGKCIDKGTQRHTTTAPTVVEGWRFTAG